MTINDSESLRRTIVEGAQRAAESSTVRESECVKMPPEKMRLYRHLDRARRRLVDEAEKMDESRRRLLKEAAVIEEEMKGIAA